MRYPVWDWGWRDGGFRDFRLWFDYVYYDGPHYCLNLGWFWICYSP